MKAFLEKIADHLIEHYQDDLGNIAVVLPSQRGGVFLKKYLSRKLDKISLAPRIISIADFATELTGLRPADPLSIPFELYKVHCEIAGDEKQSIDRFLGWSDLLIKDFSELDQYMVDVPKIFSHLSESYAMKEWNIDGSPLSEFQLNYLRFYQSLGEYYSRLRDRLLQKNEAWSGLYYRLLAENVEQYEDQIHWKKIIFAGFNALSNAETKFIQYLLKINKAEIFWDGDEYYFYKNGKGNTDIEAGLFLQRYAKKWKLPEINWIGEHFKKEKKNIQIIGVPRNIGQIKYAAEIISEFGIDLEKQTQTALVLAKENLLLPAINAMPENIEDYNITMGLPIDQLPIFDLFTLLFDLHINKSKFENKKNIYHDFLVKDLMDVLLHPVVASIIQDIPEEFKTGEQEKINTMMTILKESKQFFIPRKVINQWQDSLEDTSFKQFFRIILSKWKGNEFNAIESMKTITKLLFDPLIKSANQAVPAKEYLFLFFEVLSHIQEALTEYQEIIALPSLKKIFAELCKNKSLAFYGEPLQGIQLMGVLETRTLDFENIIMLSMNEDIIPTGKSQNSFIPDEIKLAFGLPTYKEKNAVYAYHFYRLLQRAKNVYLIYNTQTEVFGGGHKSRFINQIQMELSEYNPNIKIEEKVLSIPLSASNDSGIENNDIEIPKNQHIIDLIKEKAEKGFSPSSLNKYILCPLQFYFSEIIKLQEVEENDGSIDAATLGTVVHAVLENFYQEFKGEFLNPLLLKGLLPKVQDEAKRCMAKHFANGNIQHGKNRLIMEVGVKFVENFFQQEINTINKLSKSGSKLRIIGLEQSLHHQMENIQKVKIKGFVDRVDCIEDEVRIIDYKTGLVQQSSLRYSDMQDVFTDPKYSKVFQLLTYTWLWKKKYPDQNHTVRSGIFSFRNLKQGLLKSMKIVGPRKYEEELSIEDLNDYELHLTNLIHDIMDKEQCFSQTPDRKNCEYCDYKSICRR